MLSHVIVAYFKSYFIDINQQGFRFKFYVESQIVAYFKYFIDTNQQCFRLKDKIINTKLEAKCMLSI